MILIRIKNFIKSLWFHVYAGFPKSTQEEINYRYSICMSCEDYDQKYTMCNICGCSVNNKKQFFNKLAWADQECPASKWTKISRENK